MSEVDRPHAGGNLLLEVGASLLQRWRIVVITPVLTIAVAVVVTFALPASYVTGTVMAPFSGAATRSQIALSQLPLGVANLIGGGIGASPTESLIGVIIGSRMLNDSIARHVAKNPAEDALVHRILRKGTRVQRNPDGSIVVQVRATDPNLATRIANAFPPQLNQALAGLSTQGALRKEAFLRSQIDTAQSRVAVSEQRLLDFQQHRSAPALDQQALRTIDAAVTLQQGIYQQELAVAQLRRTATPNNAELRAALAELESRREQLRKLTSGTGATPRGTNDVFVPMGEGPELRSASQHLLRAYTQDEHIYESLLAAFTDAEIDANNNLPVLTVIDEAQVPIEPMRSWGMTIGLGLLLGLFLGVIAALLVAAAGRMRNDPGNRPFFDAWDRLREDLRVGRRTPSIAAATDANRGSVAQ